MKRWTLAEALVVIQRVEAVAVSVGLHVALAGSVLTRGTSNKDVDLIVYRHDNELTSEADVDRLIALLGFQLMATTHHGRRYVAVARDSAERRVEFFAL